MQIHCRFSLLFLFLLHTLVINAATPIRPPLSLIENLTKGGFLKHGFFPPGPPEKKYLYIVPNTNLGMVFTVLGQIPNRNEAIVKKTIQESIYESLNYRVVAKMPGQGYKLQEGNFLISVNHAAGASELTWGMWTILLSGINGYVMAYPGYDFQFEIRKYSQEDIVGYIIGAGFGVTRQVKKPPATALPEAPAN
ncbi:MAG: hypothetical protein Q9208_006389 [Pyrenodesmia sp. 3 TL-2023]